MEANLDRRPETPTRRGWELPKMDNRRHGIRATGHYAVYGGQEYFAYDMGGRVGLYTDDDPLPDGFQQSSMDWIKGEKVVALDELQRLLQVQSTCIWRGHPFEVGIIEGDSANISYLGKNFDEVCSLPGMRRPDKYEVQGRAPVSELTELNEHISEVPLDHQTNNETGRHPE